MVLLQIKIESERNKSANVEMSSAGRGDMGY